MKRSRSRALSSFTLVELLSVILIISILAGLTLAAFSGVMKTAARGRARSEIAAISTALESYNSDNGAYPTSAGFTSQNDYLNDSASAPEYIEASQALYLALTGQTSYSTPAPAGTKIYMTFKTSQLGNYQAGGLTYIQDPFGNAYGYFAGNPGNSSTVDLPYNGTNQFDLWSTGGDIAGVTNTWISNWGLGN